MDADGALVLADEIHIPDSSRFWKADTYRDRIAARLAPESFDKDTIRSWVAQRYDPGVDAISEIPADLITQCALLYVEAYEKITGLAFEPDLGGSSTLERIRTHLLPYAGSTGH